MTMEEPVRPLSAEDLRNLTVLNRLSELQLEISHRPITLQGLQAVLGRGDQVLCFWEPQEGLPVGMVTISELALITDRMLFATNLSVLRARRREGIASALLRAAEDIGRNRGIKGLTTWVNPSNTASMGLFQARGWQLLPLAIVGRRLQDSSN
jgi:ribosomal protein S18 acetylase RimI-like enzyme